MKNLPQMPYSTQQHHAQILSFRGIDLTDNYSPGSAVDTENVSTRRYPYITTRRARGVPSGEHNSFVTSLFDYNGLIKVVGQLLYIGETAAADPQHLLTSAEHQFAVVNTKLVIWPEKIYVDMSETTKVIMPLENTAVGAGGVVFNATDSQIAIPTVDEGDFTLFKENNALLVSGCSESGNNTYMRITGVESVAGKLRYTVFHGDGTTKKFVLYGVAAKDNFVTNVWLIDSDDNRTDASGWTFDNETHTVAFSTAPASGYKVEVKSKPGAVVVSVDGAYTPVTAAIEDAEAMITFARNIPDLDFICASENRLWGCSNKDQTIYASSLGDPATFYAYSGVDTDSYAVAVGTDGEFTACCAYGSSVLFWKEELLHKVLGSYPSQYQIYTYNLNGVKKGCRKSLVNVSDTLFFVSLHGVCTYSGGAVRTFSSALGETDFSLAAAGSDGENYYLSALTNGKWNLWCYSMKTGLWVREDDTEVVEFTTIGKTVYGIRNRSVLPSLRYGDVFIVDGGDPIDADTPWMIQFTPFVETVAGTYNSKSSIFAKKRYGKLRFRVDVPSGSYMVASVRMDGGRWFEAGRVVGDKAGTQLMVVPVKVCDKFELKLEGKGPATILNFDREYTVGTEI